VARKRRVGRVVSESRYDIRGDNRQTRPGVEHDRYENSRLAIYGFEQKVSDNG